MFVEEQGHFYKQRLARLELRVKHIWTTTLTQNCSKLFTESVFVILNHPSYSPWMIQYHEYGFRKTGSPKLCWLLVSCGLIYESLCRIFCRQKKIRGILTNFKIFGTDWQQKYKLFSWKSCFNDTLACSVCFVVNALMELWVLYIRIA